MSSRPSAGYWVQPTPILPLISQLAREGMARIPPRFVDTPSPNPWLHVQNTEYNGGYSPQVAQPPGTSGQLYSQGQHSDNNVGYDMTPPWKRDQLNMKSTRKLRKKLKNRQKRERKEDKITKSENLLKHGELGGAHPPNKEAAIQSKVAKVKLPAPHILKKLIANMPNGQPVALDLSYLESDNITQRELTYLRIELFSCWDALHRVKQPPCVTLTNVKKDCKFWQQCCVHPKIGIENLPWMMTEDAIEDYYNDKSKYGNIIYMTDDAKDSLIGYDVKPNDVLVIGGLLDNRRHETVALQRAASMGAVMKRIPVREIMTPASSSHMLSAAKTERMFNLTPSETFKILAGYLSNGKNWTGALYDIMKTRRKGLVIRDPFVGMLPGNDPWRCNGHKGGENSSQLARIQPAEDDGLNEMNVPQSTSRSNESLANKLTNPPHKRKFDDFGDDDDVIIMTNEPLECETGEPLAKMRNERTFPIKKRVDVPDAGFGRDREYRKGVSPAQAYVSAHKTNHKLPSPPFAQSLPRFGQLHSGPRPRFSPQIPVFAPKTMFAPVDAGQARYWRTYKMSHMWIARHKSALNAVQGDAKFPFAPPPVLCAPPPNAIYYHKNDEQHASESCADTAHERVDEVECQTSDVDTDADSEHEMTDEMIEFFRTTLKHREERDALKAEAERKKKDDVSGWLQENTEHIAADRVDVTASTQATTAQPTVGLEKQERQKEAVRLYGNDCQKITAMETLLQMQFDRQIDESKPPVWPVIPFKL